MAEGHAAGSSQRTVQPSRASVKESNDGFVCAGRTCSRQQPAHSSTQSKERRQAAAAAARAKAASDPSRLELVDEVDEVEESEEQEEEMLMSEGGRDKLKDVAVGRTAKQEGRVADDAASPGNSRSAMRDRESSSSSSSSSSSGGASRSSSSASREGAELDMAAAMETGAGLSGVGETRAERLRHAEREVPLLLHSSARCTCCCIQGQLPSMKHSFFGLVSCTAQGSSAAGFKDPSHSKTRQEQDRPRDSPAAPLHGCHFCRLKLAFAQGLKWPRNEVAIVEMSKASCHDRSLHNQKPSPEHLVPRVCHTWVSNRAGVYHPDSPNYVQPNGAGITNTIQTLYPELHRQHVQGHILEISKQLVRNSPTPIHLYKVKSHAGIAGNKCAGAVAKHQAIQGNDAPADTTSPCVNLEGSPIHGTTWFAIEEAARSHASTSERPNSPAPKFKHFSNLHDALRTYQHSKHRLGKADFKAGYKGGYKGKRPQSRPGKDG
eukprot:1152769-Pelagomonas_calceolata.AAC.8